MKHVKPLSVRYEISPEAERAIKDYLLGKFASRELGKRLGISHQQSLNLASKVCRQWIQEEKLRFK